MVACVCLPLRSDQRPFLAFSSGGGSLAAGLKVVKLGLEYGTLSVEVGDDPFPAGLPIRRRRIIAIDRSHSHSCPRLRRGTSQGWPQGPEGHPCEEMPRTASADLGGDGVSPRQVPVGGRSESCPRGHGRVPPRPPLARTASRSTSPRCAGVAGAIRNSYFDVLRSVPRMLLQLRHTAATLIEKRYGLEAAAAVLGHARVDTTQIYLDRDLTRAHAVAAEIG